MRCVFLSSENVLFVWRQKKQLKRILILGVKAAYFHMLLMLGQGKVYLPFLFWGAVSGKAEVRALTCPGLFLVEVSLSLHTQQCVFVFSEALSQSVRCRIEVCVTRSRQGELVVRPSSNRNVSLDAFVRKNYDPDLSIQSLQLLSLY